MKQFFLRTLSALLVVAILATSVQAQVHAQPCGTSHEDLQIMTQQLLRNKAITERLGIQQRGPITYVPMIFHIVSYLDGTGRISESSVLDMLCDINRQYLDQDIQFYLRPTDAQGIGGFNYINNDGLFDTPRGAGGTAIANFNKKNNAINVFICNNLTSGAGQGTTLGYYQNALNGTAYSADWIMMLNSYVNGNANTIVHELGHFFSLLHTHNGWDNGPFVPTTAQPCAPLYSPLNVPSEYVTRDVATANCATAGDYFCDTPADYNGLNSRVTNCTYSNGWKDPNCVNLASDVRNIMSYFEGCQSLFSTSQKANIRTDLTVNSRRGYVRPGITPNQTELGTAATLLTPANLAQTSFSNRVDLDWTDVPGADFYLVEVSVLNTFENGGLTIRKIVTTSQATVTNTADAPTVLAPNTTRFWRVRAFNAYKTCLNRSAVQRFTAGTLNATNEIAAITSFKVFSPDGDKTIQAQVFSNESFDATVKIYDIAGHLMMAQKWNITEGGNNLTLPTAQYVAGMYLVSIEAAKGVSNQKIVLTR